MWCLESVYATFWLWWITLTHDCTCTLCYHAQEYMCTCTLCYHAQKYMVRVEDEVAQIQGRGKEAGEKEAHWWAHWTSSLHSLAQLYTP